MLDGIDLVVEPGKTVALIGRTGSGKTTLASLVPRFYDAGAGRVEVDGVDVREVTRRSLRREIEAHLQDPFLFSERAREHRLRRSGSAGRAVEAAAPAQAHGSSWSCRTGTRRRSASAGSHSPAGRGSGSRSRAPW